MTSYFLSIFLCLRRQHTKMAKHFFAKISCIINCGIEINSKRWNLHKFLLYSKWELAIFLPTHCLHPNWYDNTWLSNVCINFRAGSFTHADDLTKCAIFRDSIAYFSTSIVLVSGFLLQQPFAWFITYFSVVFCFGKYEIWIGTKMETRAHADDSRVVGQINASHRLSFIFSSHEK